MATVFGEELQRWIEATINFACLKVKLKNNIHAQAHAAASSIVKRKFKILIGFRYMSRSEVGVIDLHGRRTPLFICLPAQIIKLTIFGRSLFKQLPWELRDWRKSAYGQKLGFSVLASWISLFDILFVMFAAERVEKWRWFVSSQHLWRKEKQKKVEI